MPLIRVGKEASYPLDELLGQPYMSLDTIAQEGKFRVMESGIICKNSGSFFPSYLQQELPVTWPRSNLCHLAVAGDPGSISLFTDIIFRVQQMFESFALSARIVFASGRGYEI